MADYKEILMGTFKTVVDKVRDIAENDAVQDVVGKVKGFAESDAVQDVVNKVRDAAESSGVRGVYEQGAGKARTCGSIAKLSLEINGDSEELKRIYAEIGKLYYEQAKDTPEGFFAPLFVQVEELEARIREKQDYVSALRAELSAGKGESAEADIEVDIVEESELEPISVEEAFEEVVEDTEKDGAGIE